MQRVLFHALMAVFFPIFSNVAIAQQQTTGVSQEATGSTTEGLGGLTTEGLDSNGTDSGGLPGANSAQGFVGASETEGFVGGSRESTNNSAVNRFFREIAAGEVPTGGTQDSSASPRRVPVRLRLGFEAPSPQAATAMAGVGGISLQKFLKDRPALTAVEISMNAAGTATLAGTVSEAAAKRLAANLIRLQPGVRQVINRIAVIGIGRRAAELFHR